MEAEQSKDETCNSDRTEVHTYVSQTKVQVK